MTTSDRLLPLKAVMDKIGMGSTWIYERIKTGEFPKPIKFSERCVRWRESEIQNWIESLPRQE